ncbi:MAG: hypothetical protein J7623_19665 [Chitinophaga sp.]|uniref:hypothetical protein n=1 Tax=Chitinophaga sp. TaxID=1869181 RepID=UPI001B2652B5|nr:hypothetical protein [Chitinophaga sp.]MBO9730867.1 hypothetical protein [Chitinophaga sp.]
MLIKIIIIISTLLFSVITTQGQQSVRLQPDTAVNHINISDYKSTIHVLGKTIWDKHFEQAGSLPRIEILNKTNTQALRLFFHYGGAENAVDEFEIITIDSSYKSPRAGHSPAGGAIHFIQWCLPGYVQEKYSKKNGPQVPIQH